MIRAAIVGLGRWGRSLVASVAGKSDEIGFVLACTRTRGGAEDFCREHKLPLVDSYEEVLRRPDIDAVVLATPHSLHEAQALAALAAGKHVFVEKPLTLDLKSARHVARRRRQGRPRAGRRPEPPLSSERLSSCAPAAQDGRLGRIVAMVAQHTTSTAQFVALDNWRAAPEEAPGGAFTAVGVHALDYMIALAGRVREVRCVTARNYPGRSDDTTTHHAAIRRRRVRLDVLLGRDRHQFRIHRSTARTDLARFRGPNLSRLRFAPAATDGADRADSGAARRDLGNFRL